MNKKIKGAIAAGAAALLLTGGAGTFAAWNDSKDLNGGKGTTGKLAFGDNIDSGWYEGTDTRTAGKKIPDITTYRIIPGTKLTYKASTSFVAQGDNLKAKLEIAGADATNVNGFQWEATKFSGDQAISAAGEITPDSGASHAVTVTKTVLFDATGIANQAVTNDLTGLKLKLSQTN